MEGVRSVHRKHFGQVSYRVDDFTGTCIRVRSPQKNLYRKLCQKAKEKHLHHNDVAVNVHLYMYVQKHSNKTSLHLSISHSFQKIERRNEKGTTFFWNMFSPYKLLFFLYIIKPEEILLYFTLFITIFHLSFVIACLNTTCLLSINRTFVLIIKKIFIVFAFCC